MTQGCVNATFVLKVSCLISHLTWHSASCFWHMAHGCISHITFLALAGPCVTSGHLESGMAAHQVSGKQPISRLVASSWSHSISLLFYCIVLHSAHTSYMFCCVWLLCSKAKEEMSCWSTDWDFRYQPLANLEGFKLNNKITVDFDTFVFISILR